MLNTGVVTELPAPLTLRDPLISSFVEGVVVPMPTLPLASTRTVSFPPGPEPKLSSLEN